MSYPNQPVSHEDGQNTWLLIAGVVFVLAWFYLDSIVSISCTILYWLWRLSDFQFIHAYAAPKINLLARTVNHAGKITYTQWIEVLNHTSGILFIFLIPMVISGIIALINHPSLPFRSKRIINIHTLPGIMSRFSPGIIPIIADSDTSSLLLNDNRPQHRWAMKPEEFAEQHSLIETRILNRKKAEAVFLAQLGPVFSSPDTLQDYEKALFTIFGLQVFLGDRKTAKSLLDGLNRSCLGKGKQRKKGLLRPNFSLTDKHFPKVWNTPQMKELRKTHRYVRTALAGLVGRDIHLPGSQYRWLKGIDRPLWYGLHSADTQNAFIEGAGILSQARFENVAFREGLNIRIDYMESAIDGLQTDLQDIGLVHERRLDKETKQRKEPDWLPATLGSDDFLPVDEVMEPPQPRQEATEPDIDAENLAPPEWATDYIEQYDDMPPPDLSHINAPAQPEQLSPDDDFTSFEE